MMRPRPHPSARQTPISYRRAAPRSISRFATFEHTMSVTRPVRPRSTENSDPSRCAGPMLSGSTYASRPAFSGYVAARRPLIIRSSSRASSSVTPSRNRPIACSQRVSRVSSARASPVSTGFIVIGTQTSNARPANVPPKFAGATPMIATSMPLSRMCRPIAVASPPKRCTHSRWLMTASGASFATRDSPRANARPTIGDTPSTSK